MKHSVPLKMFSQNSQSTQIHALIRTTGPPLSKEESGLGEHMYIDNRYTYTTLLKYYYTIHTIHTNI